MENYKMQLSTLQYQPSEFIRKYFEIKSAHGIPHQKIEDAETEVNLA